MFWGIFAYSNFDPPIHAEEAATVAGGLFAPNIKFNPGAR
jgi:hypothetical protein